MAQTNNELKGEREDLEWLQVPKSSFKQKAESKGVFTYLVPVGCAATVGVLTVGLINMYKRNSRKQQMCMRYRVLSQGVTIALAVCAILQTQK